MRRRAWASGYVVRHERPSNAGWRSTTAKVQRSIAAFRALTAPLAALSEPPGADVLIDGVKIGTTPLASESRIDLGRRRIVLTLAGHRDAEQSLEVTGPVELSLVLEPRINVRAGTRRLEIQSEGVPPFSSAETSRRAASAPAAR